MEIKIKHKEQKSTLKVLETIQMSIEDSPEANVMMFDSLITSYQHPIRTGVQEIISNARDSHRVHGTKKAIDIQLPTNLNPEWSCRDYGTGIAPDNMSIFMTLFKSTKRSDNKLTGGFGLGCKSFYAYTDSFTVISYFDGEMRTYRASRAKNPLGELTLLSVIPTTEQNGIKIQVAVKPQDRQEFKNAVVRLMTYWKDQEINVINDNAMPVEKAIHTYKNIELFNRNSSNSNIEFVVDGVPYGINNIISDAILNFQQNLKKHISIRIDNGVLELSKFREYIIVNEGNKDKIHSILKQTTKTLTELKDSIVKEKQYSKISEIDLSTFDLIFSYFNSCPITLIIDDKKVSSIINANNYGKRRLHIPFTNKNAYYTNISKSGSSRNSYHTYKCMSEQKEFVIELADASNFYYVDQEMSKNSLYKKINSELSNVTDISLLSNILTNGLSDRSIKVATYKTVDSTILPIIKFLEGKKASEIVITHNNTSSGLPSISSDKVKREKALHKSGNYYKAYIYYSGLSMSSSNSVTLCPKTKKTLFTNKTVYILDKDLFTYHADQDSKEYKKLHVQMSILGSFGYDVVYIPRSHESYFEGTENLQSMESIFTKKFEPTNKDIAQFNDFYAKQRISKLVKRENYVQLIIKEKLSNSKELKLLSELSSKKYQKDYTRNIDIMDFTKCFTSMVKDGTMLISDAERVIQPLVSVGEKYKFLNLFESRRDESKEDIETITNLIKALNKVK